LRDSCRDSAMLKRAWHCSRCSKNSANFLTMFSLHKLFQKLRLETSKNSYLELRCKNSTFFNTCNIFLKKFFQGL